MLKGGRSYDQFMACMLPILFNLFSRSNHEQEQRVKLYLAHILQVHDEYLKNLKKRLGREAIEIARDYPPTDNMDVSVGLIRKCNRIVKRIDNDVDSDDWDNLKEAMSIVDIPQPQRETLRITTDSAHVAFNQLSNFRRHIEEKHKLYYSPLQTMYQFMAYGSHVSKGYVLLLRNRTHDGCIQDLESVIRHLRRVTLDMRKAILHTVFRHAPTIPPDIVRAVLRARRNDLHIGYQDPQKLHIYEAELHLVLKSNLL
ncbi:MAG: hypothetical protein NTZ09_04640 [Candidatus Hydrogenedentes bacterium]|nr:hypothetical protein [Candidatus Hydrogenedentota bacterium]